MAEQKRKISYGINFEVNDAELKKLKKQLEQLQKLSVVNYANQQGISLNNPATAEKQTHQLTKLKKDAAEFQRLMRLAYNPKTNSYNITKFNTALKQSGLNVKSFRAEMQKTAEGRAVWAAQTHELTKFNTEIKQSHKLLDALGTTLANTIKWTISSSIMQGVTRSISQAYGFAKNLDSALNDIRIVTGKSADEMVRFAERANAVASNLGKGTNDYTRAALIYAQQGLGQKEIEEKTAITLKTANVTGQSAEEVSEELTAVWNGYKVSAEQAELYVDRLAAVASTTASDLQELSTGMSKVASAAAAMGVGEDQLAAQLSTIISVTRQAPETVGTALRTVYARITDIQAGIDEDGVTLGKYSGDMAKIGINVLDLNGNLRNMGEVMEEIGNKWSTMTQEQKIYLAQTMAGQRQYSNLMALFDNFDKYESALNTAQNAGGKLQEQQDVYMDRLSTHVQQLTTATEHMWMGLFDTDGFKDVIDGLTTIVEKVDKLFQSIGGGKNLLQSLVPIVMSLTSKTVASGINTMIMNSQLEKRQLRDQISSQALAQKEMKGLQREGQQGSQRYQVFKQESEFLQAAPGTFSTQQMDEINKRWSGSLEAAAEADKRKTELNQYSDITRSITTTLGNNVVDLKETLSIEDLENAIIDVGGQYDELSIRIKQYARDQDAINKQQDAARQKLIEAYSQTATKIVSEKNESQFKQFNVKNLKKYESAQAQVISQEQQKLDSLPELSDKKKHIIDDSPLKGMFNIMQNRKKGSPTSDQISAIEKVKGFEEIQDIEGREGKIKKIREILENSIYQEIFKQMPNPKSADDFRKAVQDRFAEIEQNAKKAIQQARNKQKAASQELLRRQQTTNTYQQNFQALKGNLQIQNVDKFQNNLQFLSQDFSSMAIPPELKTQVISIKKEYQKLSQEIIKYNEKIQSSSKLSQEQIDALKKEKKALEEKQQALLDTTQGTVDSINANVQNKGQQAIDELKYSRTIGNNNRGAIKDIQNDADRQKAIQSAIQLVSALGQVQMGFENFLNVFQIVNDDTLSFGEKFSQTLRNLTMAIPMVVSGIISMKKAYTSLNGVQGVHQLLQKKITFSLKEQLILLKTNIVEKSKNLLITLKDIPAKLSDAIANKTLSKSLKEVTASAATANMSIGASLAVLTAVVIAIVAIKTAVESRNKQAQQTIKLNEELIEKEKEKQKTISHEKDIISEVKQLNEEYKNGIITRQELKEKTEQLQEKYKDESDSIKELVSDYTNLDKALQKIQDDNDLAQLESDKDMATYKAAIAKSTEEGAVKGNEWWRSASLAQMSSQTQGKTVIQVGLGDATQFGSKLTTALSSRGAGQGKSEAFAMTAAGTLLGTVFGPLGSGLGAKIGQELSKNSLTQVDINDISTKAQLKSLVEGLKDAIDQATEDETDDATYLQTVQLYNTFSEQLKEWQAADLAVLHDIAHNTAKAASKNFNFVDSFDEYQKAYSDSAAQMYEKLSNSNQKYGEGDYAKTFNEMTPDEQWDIISSELEKVIPQDLKTKYGDHMDALNLYNHLYGNGYFKSGKENDSSMVAMVEGLNEDQLKIWDSYLEDASQADLTTEQINKTLDYIVNHDFSKLTFNEAEAEKAAQTYNNMANALEKIQNGKGISKKDFETYGFANDDELKDLFRFGNSGYVLKDPADQKKVEELIKQKQRSGWDAKYLANEKKAKNNQQWIKSGAGSYKIQEWTAQDQKVNNQNAQQMIEHLEKFADSQTQVELQKYKDQIANNNEQVTETVYNNIYDLYQKLQSTYKDAEKPTEAQKEALQNIHDTLFPTDKDIDETIVAQLGEQFQLTAQKSELLEDALKNNAKQAREVAEQVQRYDAALKSVIKNYGNWSNVLQNGSTAEKLAVMPQIKNSMADTLGISEITLSNSFVTTKQNLEDMRLALEGDEKAYKRLQQAAYNDILLHVGLDDTDLNEVQILLEDYFKDLDLDVAVGAELDKFTLEEVLATLIKKGIDTEQQLEAIFAAKGVDLNVVVENGKAEILSYTKAATHELKQQEKSQEELKNLERDRIKNQKELTKYLKDDRDIYHEINILLADQERIIKRITKNQDSMYGKELLENLSAQTNELKKQQSLLKRKQQLQLQDMANRRSALAAQGAAFDANGNISNYNNLISSAMNQINEVIGRQNSIITAMNNIINSGGSTSDEAYKDLDAQMTLVNREKSNAQDYLNNLKSDLSAYESVKSEFENVIDQLSEIAYQKIELRLKEFKVKVDVKLDLIQLQKNYDDFRRNIVEHDDILNPDNVKTILKDSAQYFSDALAGMNYLPALTDDLKKAIDEANKFNNVNYDPTQDPSAIFKTQGQARAYLQQTLEKVNSQSKDILSNIDEIKNKILDLANELKDVYDKQEQHLTFIREQINHNISLSKLLYGEESYKNLNKYYDQLKKYNLQSVADAKSQQEMFLELYQKETNQALKDIYLENYKQATKTLNSILESSLQDLKTRYENVIDGVLKNTKERLEFTYNTGLEWDLMKKQNDAFLDNVNSAFAIKNTEFLYNQAINDIDNISAQQKLKKVMDQQLEILKEKEKLTQYDVDRAQKVLDIEKARIALEEAQNNKTNMKLKRDSQGNYSYQYVVDQDEIAKAQNDLQKAQNDLYNFDKENYIKNLDQAQQLYEEYAEKIKEIKLNDNLTEQEQIKAIALLNEDFNKRGLNIWKQNEFIKKNLMDSTANNLKIDLGNMSEAERNYLMGQSIPMWGSAAQEILNKFINDPNSVQNELNNMYLSLNQAQNDYEISIEETLQKAGTSYEDFKNTAIDPVIKSMETLIKDNNKLAEDAEKIVNKMQPLKTTLEGLTTKWDEMKSKIEQVNEAITEYLRKMGQATLAAQNSNDGDNGGGTGSFDIPESLKKVDSTFEGKDLKKQPTGNPLKDSPPKDDKKPNTDDKKQNTNDKFAYMTLEQALQQEGVPNFWDEISKADMPQIIKDTIRGEYAKAKSSGSSFGYSMYKALSKSKELGGVGFLNQQIYGMTQSIIQTIVSKAANRAAKSYGWGNNYLGRWGYNGYHNPEYIAHVFSNQKDLMKDNGLIKKFWSSFDTGGYTGSWNSSEGKIAMLHQKELVLNKQDTKNILNAVSLVRTITSNLTSNLISQINNIDKIKDTTKSLINDKNNEIEQNVKIQANFPNVNSKQEIEDAFAELVNMAAQRALERTRKK